MKKLILIICVLFILSFLGCTNETPIQEDFLEPEQENEQIFKPEQEETSLVPSRENPFFLQPYNDLKNFYSHICGLNGYIIGEDQFNSEDIYTFSFPSDSVL